MIYADWFRPAGPVDGRPRRVALMGAILALVAVLPLAGCGGGNKTVDAPPAVAPPPSYTGPQFLRGTIGSMVSLRPGDDRPQLVSGYGVVVFPPGTGTGSPEVPPRLRQRLIQEMRKKGVGSPRIKATLPDAYAPFFSLSPERFLDSPDTAIVAVQGLIPPGATRGQKFDVLVSAIDSQTTSLAGGTLWTVTLGVGGTNPSIEFYHPLAEAYGSVYVDPFDDQTLEDEKQEFRRQGVVVLGGEVTQPRRIELLLHQPSWTRSRVIANRINERFGRSADRVAVANPQSDLRIQLTVPDRWAHQPDLLLNLIGHMFVDRGPGFETRKTQELAEVLREMPNGSRSVVAAWRALGRGAIEALRTYYDDPMPELRLSALEAGAWLNDERAARYLDELANDENPRVRARAADALVYLPSSIQGARTLKRLLDDDDTAVRIAAYESLATINDTRILRRVPISNGAEVKFLVDEVPATKPLIYITQASFPRLVVFGEGMRLPAPLLARMWDNHLMLRLSADDQPVELFYQAPNQVKPQTHKVYPPTVLMLAYALGHRPNAKDLQDGLDLPYSQVVDAVYHLVKAGHLDTPIEFNLSPLAERVEALEDEPLTRPETITEPDSEGAPAPGIAPDLEPAPDPAAPLSAAPGTGPRAETDTP